MQSQYGWNRYSGDYSEKDGADGEVELTILSGQVTKISVPNITNLPNWVDHTANTTYNLALQSLIPCGESLNLVGPYEAREKSNLTRSRNLRFSSPEGICDVSKLSPVRILDNPFYQVGSYFKKHPDHEVREKEWIMSKVWANNFARWFHFASPDFTWTSKIADFEGCD